MSDSPGGREGGGDSDQGPEDLRSDSKKKAAGSQAGRCWWGCTGLRRGAAGLQGPRLGAGRPQLQALQSPARATLGQQNWPRPALDWSH